VPHGAACSALQCSAVQSQAESQFSVRHIVVACEVAATGMLDRLHSLLVLQQSKTACVQLWVLSPQTCLKPVTHSPTI
jgi:hypothetical protein